MLRGSEWTVNPALVCLRFYQTNKQTSQLVVVWSRSCESVKAKSTWSTFAGSRFRQSTCWILNSSQHLLRCNSPWPGMHKSSNDKHDGVVRLLPSPCFLSPIPILICFRKWPTGCAINLLWGAVPKKKLQCKHNQLQTFSRSTGAVIPTFHLMLSPLK